MNPPVRRCHRNYTGLKSRTRLRGPIEFSFLENKTSKIRLAAFRIYPLKWNQFLLVRTFMGAVKKTRNFQKVPHFSVCYLVVILSRLPAVRISSHQFGFYGRNQSCFAIRNVYSRGKKDEHGRVRVSNRSRVYTAAYTGCDAMTNTAFVSCTQGYSLRERDEPLANTCPRTCLHTRLFFRATFRISGELRCKTLVISRLITTTSNEPLWDHSTVRGRVSEASPSWEPTFLDDDVPWSVCTFI